MAGNASLLLTKAMRVDHNVPQKELFESKVNRERFETITHCAVSDDYRRAFERWEERIGALPGATLAATFDVDDRVIVGIGAENILESSIAIDRLWGTPIIPGSSLKGLASHYTAAGAAAAGFTEEHLVDLFGTTEWAGCVRWLDAWFDPASTDHPFALDVVTVHHQSYYGDPSKPPTDFEDPKPNTFLTARGRFLVAVQAPNREWAEAAMELLRRALAQWGVGAKTNAGYGRLCLREYRTAWKVDQDRRARADVEAEAAKRAEEDAAREALEKELEAKEAEARAHRAFLAEIADIDNDGLNQAANRWCAQWSKLQDEDEKREVARAIVARWRGKPSVLKRVAEREWAKPVIAMGSDA